MIADELVEKEPEVNFVKLIGSAWDNSIRLLGGELSCKIPQRCINDAGQQFSITHMINVPPKLRQVCGIDSLTRGQKVNINGYVQSIPFTISNGKLQKAFAIIPHDIQVYESGKEPIRDVCIVMMTAFIESPLYNSGNILSFDLRTHVAVRNEDGESTGESLKYSHPVIVTDRELQQYIRSNVSQYDKVFLEGYINYQPVQTEDGKVRMSGSIIPVHIEKIVDSVT